MYQTCILIDNVKSSFLDHLSDIFKKIVCILNCHSLSNTPVHVCLFLSQVSVLFFFSLSLYLLSFSLYVTFLVFGILCFVFVVVFAFVFFSPYLLCVPYLTPRLFFFSLLVTEIFSSDKKISLAIEI